MPADPLTALPVVSIPLSELLRALPRETRSQILEDVALRAGLPADPGAFRVCLEIRGEVALQTNVTACSIQPWE